MPNSQVPSIFLNQDGTISIQVDVYDFDAGTPVEITGQATQENGAVASFYSVQDVPAHADGQSASISVRSVPVVAPNEFVPGFPVTITVKAALAWTVEMDPIPAGRLQNIEPAPKGGWKSDSFGAAVQPLAPAAPVAPPAQLRHGKWWDGVKRDPLTSVMAGRFTRLFPELPGAQFAQADLEKLAEAMTALPEAEQAGPDPEENPGLPAAYTYLGQFVDHDLTFDPASQLRRRVTTKRQLQALADFRTPRSTWTTCTGTGRMTSLTCTTMTGSTCSRARPYRATPSTRERSSYRGGRTAGRS